MTLCEFRCGFVVILVILGLVSPQCAGQATSERQSQIHESDAMYRRLMAQVSLAQESGDVDEVLTLLQKLEDEAEGRVTPYPPEPLNPSFRIQRYVPISATVAWSRASILAGSAVARDQFQSGKLKTIETRLSELRGVEDISAWAQLGQLAQNTDYEVELLVQLGDRYLQRGWIQAARDCYQRTSIGLRAPVFVNRRVERPESATETSPANDPKDGNVRFSLSDHRSSIPWHFILRLFPDTAVLGQDIVASIQQPIGPSRGSTGVLTPPRVDVMARLVWCSVLEGDIKRAALERRLIEAVYSDDREDKQIWLRTIDRWLAEQRTWEVASATHVASTVTFGGNSTRHPLEPSRPTEKRIDFSKFSDAATPPTFASLKDINGTTVIWEHRLMRRMGNVEVKTEWNSRAMESSTGVLSYYPAIYGDRVFVNELGRILAFDLSTGKAWPDPELNAPLYLHQRNDDAVVPMGYAAMGLPRGTVTIVDDRLYARVGTVVTGWRNPNEFSTRSQSAIVGLDLRREGRLLPGFPIFLSGSEWRNMEFEGSPLVIDRDLFVVVTQRAGVEVQRFVACFDSFSGKLRWRSQLIAGGWVPRSEQANMISHQLLSYSSGRLFLDSGLGVIAALDARTGQMVWLVRHPVVDDFADAYPRSQRFRARDLTPPMIYRDMVICAPSSCRELFALDWGTGDLLWATVEGQATDVTHLLCVIDDKLIASGDRLWWIDIHSGRALARFPENGSDLPGFATPHPRGLGRGCLLDDHVLWPSAGKLLVIDGKLQTTEVRGAAPLIRATLPIGPRLSEGANLVTDGRTLVLATPSRLFAIQP